VLKCASVVLSVVYYYCCTIQYCVMALIAWFVQSLTALIVIGPILNASKRVHEYVKLYKSHDCLSLVMYTMLIVKFWSRLVLHCTCGVFGSRTPADCLTMTSPLVVELSPKST